jgi:hypothetical protein
VAEVEWNPIEWSRAERANFVFLRSCSNETEVLAAAIESAIRDTWPTRPRGAALIDFGSERSGLSDRLSALFETYVPLPIDGRETARRLLQGLERDGDRVLPEFDVCLFSHVIPYIVDLDRTFTILARRSSAGGVGVAVLCDEVGDQHEIGCLAGAYDPGYARTHDHAERFASFLTARGTPFRSFSVLSQATVPSAEAALRIVAFFIGSNDSALLSRLGSHLIPDADGAFTLTSGHRVFTWSMDAFGSHAEGVDSGRARARAGTERNAERRPQRHLRRPAFGDG